MRIRKIKVIEIQKQVNYLITLAETKKRQLDVQREKIEVSFYTVTNIQPKIQCTVEQ